MPQIRTNDIIKQLCRFPDRRLGSRANQDITAWTASRLEDLGWDIEVQEFDCMDWICNSSTLSIGEQRFEVHASPYSPPTDIDVRMVVASTVEELEPLECEGLLLLLYGEITQEPLMPKNFPFFNPEAHQQMVALLERKSPAAILTATGRHPALAGGAYPFPMIEDGDFDIPSAYLTDSLGLELAKLQSRQGHLVLDVERIPSSGANVIAFKPGQHRSEKLIVCAHLDTKINTPGAIDNAAGVGVLLLLAERLRAYSDRLGIDLIVFNGEDYYGANGEKAYLETLRQHQNDTLLAVNIDAAGYLEGSTSYSLYECTESMASITTRAFSSHPEMIQGDPWYQSDHMVFVQNGVPAMAITSERFPELTANITHTLADQPQLVDSAKLEAITDALVDLIDHLNKADLNQGSMP
jgi:aminopeptidase YwaD